jgi:methanogenic corrinoid protein MtbC1
LRDEIDNRGLRGKILLAVGGAIFNVVPDLFEEVGGDLTAKNALDADEVFSRAIQKMAKGEDNE